MNSIITYLEQELKIPSCLDLVRDFEAERKNNRYTAIEFFLNQVSYRDLIEFFTSQFPDEVNAVEELCYSIIGRRVNINKPFITLINPTKLFSHLKLVFYSYNQWSSNSGKKTVELEEFSEKFISHFRIDSAKICKQRMDKKTLPALTVLSNKKKKIYTTRLIPQPERIQLFTPLQPYNFPHASRKTIIITDSFDLANSNDFSTVDKFQFYQNFLNNQGINTYDEINLYEALSKLLNNRGRDEVDRKSLERQFEEKFRTQLAVLDKEFQKKHFQLNLGFLTILDFDKLTEIPFKKLINKDVYYLIIKNSQIPSKDLVKRARMIGKRIKQINCFFNYIFLDYDYNRQGQIVKKVTLLKPECLQKNAEQQYLRTKVSNIPLVKPFINHGSKTFIEYDEPRIAFIFMMNLAFALGSGKNVLEGWVLPKQFKDRPVQVLFYYKNNRDDKLISQLYMEFVKVFQSKQTKSHYTTPKLEFIGLNEATEANSRNDQAEVKIVSPSLLTNGSFQLQWLSGTIFIASPVKGHYSNFKKLFDNVIHLTTGSNSVQEVKFAVKVSKSEEIMKKGKRFIVHFKTKGKPHFKKLRPKKLSGKKIINRRDEVRRLFLEGDHTRKEIAEKVRISLSTVHKYLKELGLTKPHNRTTFQ